MSDARALAGSHRVVEEDCWYSCPASGECCRNSAGTACDCGYDERVIAITAALEAERQKVWKGLKVTNETLEWALKELGPTGTNAEAYIKAAVEYVIACRRQGGPL